MNGTVRAAAGVLAMLFVLTGCTDAPDAPASSPGSSPSPSRTAADPPPPAPEAGACYRLTLPQVVAPTSDAEPVPCTRRHTTQTVHVGRLENVVKGHAVTVDSAHVQRQLARTCPGRLAAFVGGTPEARRLSRLSVVWFSPSLEQADAGASWFRCDVVAFGRGEELLSLPRAGALRGVLDRPGALDTYGLCGTARPGSPGFTRVACGLGHTWVAIGTLPIPGRRHYPGVPELRDAGDEACADRVRSRAGSPLEFSYGWEWPTRQQWATGQRYGFCWAPA